MAALVEGQQYGLSAQDKINCNKSLVFVKLTDSALRSIEECIKLKGDTLTKPTIEFQNNNGIITLPSLNGGSQNYGFTLSNVEADGPQGSFECLQQTGHRSLQSLGCVHMKMHIHANEDSYEKTRVKMAAAEQEHKKFCTKEIKPNGPHLGRKVKVKRPGLIVSPVKASPPSATPPKTAFKPVNIPPVKKQQEQPKLIKQNPKNKFANCPELLRQPIRDRIIHILAVRPHKRPELILRLINEGIREKDRKGITAILTQVATLKGNVYTLANYLWNEVQENWKFGTQEELEVIRKRKQQFLNANSDNEVPSPNSQPSCSPVEKRILPEPVPTAQEPRSKKLRISHYNRPENTNQASKNESSEHSASDKTQYLSAVNPQKSPYSPLQASGNRSGHGESSQKSPMGISYDNSPSQKDFTPPQSEDLLLSSSLNQRSSGSSEDSEKNIRNRNPTSGLSQTLSTYTNHNKSSPKDPVFKIGRLDTEESDHWRPTNGYQKTCVNSDSNEKPPNKTLSHPLSVDYNSKQVSPESNTHYQSKESRNSVSKTNVYGNSNSIKSKYNSHSSYMNRSKITSTTNGSCSNSPHSSSSDSRDGMEYNSPDFGSGISVSPYEYDEFPDYLKEYGTIESNEQRARYKADFNAEYEEYLRLHAVVQSISDKFASFELRLHNCDRDSEEYIKVRDKILREYETWKERLRSCDKVRKFKYLHYKLAHIKRLVMEYDHAQLVKS